MTHQEILAAIPHRDPFLLVDEILEKTASRIVGSKTFSGNEWFFAGHYQGYPLVPGVLLCEAAMQCGAILLSSLLSAGEHGAKVPVATRMSDVRFKRMVRPGEKIVIDHVCRLNQNAQALEGGNPQDLAIIGIHRCLGLNSDGFVATPK